jgi:tape measure domain-containing protein
MTTVIEDFVARLGWDIDDKDLKRFKRSTEGLGHFVKRAFQVGAAGAISLGFGVQRLLGAFSKVEDATAAFTPLLGSVKKAADLVERLNQEAATTPFQFENLSFVAEQLLPLMNRDINETIQSLRMMGDVAGGNVQKMDSVTRGFSRVLIKGRADMESLNIIAEAGIPIYQQLGETVGVSGKKLFDRMRQGKVSVEDVTETFRRMTRQGGLYFRGMDIASATLSGRVSTLKDNIILAAASLGERMAPEIKAIVDDLIDVVANTRDWIIANKELVSVRMREFIQGVVSAVKGLVSLAGFVRSLVRDVGGLSNAFKILFGIMLGAQLVPFLMSLEKILKASTGFGAAFKSAGKGILTSWGPVSALFGLIFLLVDDILASLQGRRSLGGYIAETLQISKWLYELPTLLGVPVDRLDEFYQKLEDISPIFSKGLADGFTTLFGIGYESILDFMDRVGASVMQVFGMIGDGVKAVIEATGLGSVFRFLSGNKGGVSSALSGASRLTPVGPVSDVTANLPGAGSVLSNTLPFFQIPKLFGEYPAKFNELQKALGSVSAPVQKAVQKGVGAVYNFNTTVNATTNASAAEVGRVTNREMEKALARVKRNL